MVITMRLTKCGHHPVCRGLLLMTAVLLAFLCLSACSDESLYPPLDSDETIASGGLVIETPVVSETFADLIIQPPDDPFAGAEHLLQVDFLNVGDADSILIRADATVILIDVGESADYPVINARLQACGVTTIDHLIITHYDNDHIGGARSLLTDFAVKNVYMPEYIRDSGLYRSMTGVLDSLRANGLVAVNRLVEDVRIELSFGNLWINPTKLYTPGLTLGSDNSHDLQENNYSLITSLTFGEQSFLFAGDAEGERMAEFVGLSENTEPTYSVLKIPHHGRYDKQLSEFLRAETGSLRYCVVSVGSAELVENSLITAMRASGAAQYFTYNGHIRIVTDGTTMTIEQSS